MIPTIAIYTYTGLVPATLIQAWVASAQVALSRDFAPHWGDARLRYVAPGGAIDADEWQLVFFDHSDQAGALGYHDQTAGGKPLGKVFLADCIANHTNWNVTSSHEMHEMIGDPDIRKTVDHNSYEYALETDDACEDDHFAQRVAGHLQSNSVTPAWFDPNGQPPYTIYPCDEITAPFMLASGGYIGRRALPDGEWQQLFARVAGPRQIKGPSSRTLRRFSAAELSLAPAIA